VPPSQPSRSLTPRERRLLRLSNLLFILTGVVAALYAALFFFPGLVPAPLRPSALGPTASATPIPPQTATRLAPNAPTPTPPATATPTSAARTATPTRPRSSTSIEAIPTSTGTPTPTPTITPTPTATETGTPTNTPTPSRYPYTVQRGYPIYSAYPGGCNWMGFAGEVFDLEGKPVIDLIVHIGGADHLVLSGSSQEFGIKGWVDKVADRPASSGGFYSVQLQDAVGNPLSDAISLETFNDCKRNLVTLNFVQNH